MSLSEKMTALCRTLGIARDVPVRLALDMMEKNMGAAGGGLGSPSSARITFLARAQGLMG
jgi:hypothetical protein